MLENSNQRSIWLRLGIVCRLFRINSGQGWVGAGKAKRLQDGTVAIPHGRPISLGLAGPDTRPVSGVSDLIGWTPVVITPDMVGRQVAVFTSIECKRPIGGRKGKDQEDWNDLVKMGGGIVGFAASPDEAEAIVKSYNGRKIDR